MSCFCDELDDYTCCDCESRKRWDSLSNSEKEKLRLYKKIVQSDNTVNIASEFMALFKWAEKRGLSACDVQ